jgi:hypothetical protein
LTAFLAFQFQWTPLHIAADQGKAEIVKILLAAGANHRVLDRKGDTPADIAMRGPHLLTVVAFVLRVEMARSSEGSPIAAWMVSQQNQAWWNAGPSFFGIWSCLFQVGNGPIPVPFFCWMVLDSRLHALPIKEFSQDY